MQVYKIGIPEIAIAPLVSKLKSSLYVGPTLWLVSGGSNIKLSAAVMERLDSELSQDLTIALADERFGAYDHPDSNWHQFLEAGFDPKKAQVIETLHPDLTSLEETVARFNNELSAAIENNITIIGQFGMGSDGHIAGILPGSPAAIDTNELAVGYQSDPYTRITITFAAFHRLSASFVIAFGEDKRSQLENLVNTDLPLVNQPVQIVKTVGESYLYNDQIEGKQS